MNKLCHQSYTPTGVAPLKSNAQRILVIQLLLKLESYKWGWEETKKTLEALVLRYHILDNDVPFWTNKLGTSAERFLILAANSVKVLSG